MTNRTFFRWLNRWPSPRTCPRELSAWLASPAFRIAERDGYALTLFWRLQGGVFDALTPSVIAHLKERQADLDRRLHESEVLADQGDRRAAETVGFQRRWRSAMAEAVAAAREPSASEDTPPSGDHPMRLL